MNRPVTRSRLRKESPAATEISSSTKSASSATKKQQKSKLSSTSSNKKQIDKCPEQEKETVISQEKTPPVESRSRRSRLALKQVDVEQIRHVAIPEKERIVIKRTPSMKDTFPGRLEWKQKHYDKPVTSTPVGQFKSSTVSKKPSSSGTKDDIQSCFGFDDDSTDEDGDENYSVLLSPILKVKDKDKVRVQQRKDVVHFKRVPPPPGPTEPKFNDLLERYTHGDHSEEDDELHVNTKGIKATYANRHVKFEDVIDGKKRERSTSSNKSSKSTSSTTSTATTTGTTATKKRSRKPKKPKDTGTSKKDQDDADLDKWLEKKNKEFEDISNFPLVLEKSP